MVNIKIIDTSNTYELNFRNNLTEKSRKDCDCLRLVP